MTEMPDIVLQQRFEHPEGLVWDARSQRLLWVDMFKGHVMRYGLTLGSLDTLALGRSVGAVAPRASEGLICAVREGFGFLSEGGQFSSVNTFLSDLPDLRMNDGGVDARGRFWAGSMTSEQAAQPTAGALYRLDPDGTLTTPLHDIGISNGIGWSPDSTRCYYVDSATHRIDVFAYDLETGRMSDRKTLARVDAYPDGLAVDLDGCVWVALFEGWEVRRFTPSGTVDRVIRLPGSQVTTCAFGGADLRTLFIAVSAYGLSPKTILEQKAGHIFAVDVGVQGLPTHEFAG